MTRTNLECIIKITNEELPVYETVASPRLLKEITGKLELLRLFLFIMVVMPEVQNRNNNANDACYCGHELE